MHTFLFVAKSAYFNQIFSGRSHVFGINRGISPPDSVSPSSIRPNLIVYHFLLPTHFKYLTAWFNTGITMDFWASVSVLFRASHFTLFRHVTRKFRD